MDVFDVFATAVFLALTLLFIVAPILGVVAFARIRRLERSVAALRAELTRLASPASTTTPAGAFFEPPAVATAAPALPDPEPPAPVPLPVPALSVSLTPPFLTPPSPTPASLTPPSRLPFPSGAAPSWDAVVGRQWLVWVGGVSLALGGGLLVKIAADIGLFGPAVRCTVAGLLGLGLMAASFPVARRSPPEASVPGAMAGSGLFIVMAAIYAAGTLYELLAPSLAFPAMASVALAGFALSLRLGRFPAVIGLVGAMAVPVLVPSQNPDPVALYAYLILPMIAALWVVQRTGWIGLVRFNLVMCLVWVLAAPMVAGAGAGIPAAVFAILVTGLHLWVCRPRGTAVLGGTAASARRTDVDRLAINGAAAMGLGLLWLMKEMHQPDTLLPFIGLFALTGMAAARWIEAWHRLIPFGGAVSVAAVLLAEDLTASFLAAAVFGAVLAGAAAAALRASRWPAWWAWTGATVPLALLAAAHARGTGGYQHASEFFAVGQGNMSGGDLSGRDLGGGDLGGGDLGLGQIGWGDIGWNDAGWGALALLLAALATEAARRARAGAAADPALRQGLAASAVAAAGALGLGAAFTLSQAQLPLAFAAIVAGAGWVYGKIEVASLRGAALAGALGLLLPLLFVRLIDPLAFGPAGFMTVLTACLVPAGLLLWAARCFRPVHPVGNPDPETGLGLAGDALIRLLEAVGLGHGVMGLALTLRLMMAGSTVAPLAEAEIGLHAASWLIMASVLTRTRTGLALARQAADLLACCAGLALVILTLFTPSLWAGVVGDAAFFNTALIGYLLPAGCAAVYGGQFDRARRRHRIAIAAASVIGFLWLNLEVRHVFAGLVVEGGALEGGVVGDFERWVYSLAWVLYAAGLLGAGFGLGRVWLRQIGLGFMMAAILKIFLFDLANLEGVWRAASFIGLGLVILATAWAYQRFPALARDDAPISPV